MVVRSSDIIYTNKEIVHSERHSLCGLQQLIITVTPNFHTGDMFRQISNSREQHHYHLHRHHYHHRYLQQVGQEEQIYALRSCQVFESIARVKTSKK